MEVNWTKCYEDGWKDHIVPESFQHPAKMSYGLLKRILDHCKDKGWGGVIVDPFGGIGSTGILGAYEGYQVICIELEQKFVNLARKNFCLHLKTWEQFGNPYPQILQGDSRKLCELVESADIIIGSPPFGSSLESKDREFREKSTPGRTNKCSDYGKSAGQLGAMKPGKVDMVISSPPYAETMSSEKSGIDWSKIKRENGSPRDMSKEPGHKTRIGAGSEMRYGTSEGNLGNLKAGDVDVILSSPPFQKSMVESGDPNYAHKFHGSQKDYGKSAGQLGQEQGPTFWQAAKEILQQCHKILRPGGHAIWVCKDFVRKGKRVPFSDDWLRLCESVGFKLVCRHRAMLVKEEVKDDLFGGQITKKTERKSFFRRLAEAKGSPKIDWEDVICVEAGVI